MGCQFPGWKPGRGSSVELDERLRRELDSDVVKLLGNLSNQRRYVLSRLKQRILDHKIPGSILELGVWMGATSWGIRRVLKEFDPSRSFHVFDTFKGLPQPNATADGAGKFHYKGAFSFSMPAYVKGFVDRKLTPPVLHAGRFGELPDVEFPEPVAFAYFDGDLHDSITESFAKVWHKMSPGGVVMVHDYFKSCTRNKNCWLGPANAVDEFLHEHAHEHVRVSECYDIIALIIKPKVSQHRRARG